MGQGVSTLCSWGTLTGLIGMKECGLGEPRWVPHGCLLDGGAGSRVGIFEYGGVGSELPWYVWGGPLGPAFLSTFSVIPCASNPRESFLLVPSLFDACSSFENLPFKVWAFFLCPRAGAPVLGSLSDPSLLQ